VNILGLEDAERGICPMALEHLASSVLATRLARYSRRRSGSHVSALRKHNIVTGNAIEKHR